MIRIDLLLLVGVVACALALVQSNHRARKLFTQLEQEQKRQRELDVEWGQLQLELSTWAAHGRIEKIARERLAMRPPATGELMSLEVGR